MRKPEKTELSALSVKILNKILNSKRFLADPKKGSDQKWEEKFQAKSIGETPMPRNKSKNEKLNLD